MIPPPSFPVELEEEEMQRSQRRQDREKIREVLQETIPNRMMVGKQGSRIVKRLWQPHNYRLYFNFNQLTFNRAKGRFKSKNFNSEHQLFFDGCLMTIKRKQIEIINKKHDGEWWHIYAKNLKDIDERITELVNKLDYECIKVLRAFIKRFGGSSDLEIVKRRDENGLKGDDYIDQIPDNMIIHDYPNFKKVYKKKTEIYGVANTRRFLRNRIIEDIAPEINLELNKLHKVIKSRSKIIEDMKMLIHGLNDVVTHKDKFLGLNPQDTLSFKFIYLK